MGKCIHWPELFFWSWNFFSIDQNHLKSLKLSKFLNIHRTYNFSHITNTKLYYSIHYKLKYWPINIKYRMCLFFGRISKNLDWEAVPKKLYIFFNHERGLFFILSKFIHWPELLFWNSEYLGFFLTFSNIIQKPLKFLKLFMSLIRKWNLRKLHEINGNDWWNKNDDRNLLSKIK